ncbi:MAG: hypothetical protein ACREJ3_05720 [Polyangiaceae bacterium]
MGLLCGCGTSASTPAAGNRRDASVGFAMVVTAGGGAAASSSGGGAIVNPFGNLPDAAGSGVSSGSGSLDAAGSGASSGGDAAGSGASSGGDAAASGSDGGSSGAADASAGVCSSYTAPMCGTTPCDLRSNTCCVQFSLAARCIAGKNAQCASNEVTVHCLQACECGGGESCCGVENTLLGVVTSTCQNVPSGANCQPYPQTNTQAAAQLCQMTSECQNGQPCTAQTCIYGAMLKICGLQSQAPFNCH